MITSQRIGIGHQMAKEIIANTCQGFACVRTQGGYSWSLVSALGEYLEEAERRYGPRDKSWTILGVEVGITRENPGVWFPGNRRQVSVILSRNAAQNSRKALFQLAHEVVHLLAPRVPPPSAPRIEEGVAVVFSDEMSATDDLNVWTDGANYLEAKRLVQQLLALDPDAIRKLREREPYFGSMTPALLREVVPALPELTARLLCEPM